jgi:radical SAM protein with 4Fe4S-binding SPASM domain
MADLGIKYINFERVTPNGNALEHIDDGIMPGNKNLDKFFLKMWEQSVENETYKYINNMFFDSILTQMVHSTHAGCRCRQCEQKILTINADGNIGGCPNSAVEKTFGTIDDDIAELMTSPGRMCNINAESIRMPACFTCEVFDICNGDCHQLAWEGNVCAAPKSLMEHLKNNNDQELFKKFLDGFMGQE